MTGFIPSPVLIPTAHHAVLIPEVAAPIAPPVPPKAKRRKRKKVSRARRTRPH